jgi:Archaeal phage integrase
MLNFSMKYWQMVRDPSRLLTLPASQRPYVMRALANFAKFTGQYEEWQRGLRANRISWGGKTAAEVFMAILEEQGVEEDADEWLAEALAKLPRRYGLVLVFQRLTGLRIQEACKAFTLLVQENEGYYDPTLMVLRHFQYPQLFLRKSKNVFISFVSPQLLEMVTNCGEPVTKEGLHMVMVRAHLRERTTTLRKAFATQLRQAGIPRESIDLIQGRIPRSVFSQHYYRPALNALREEVLKTLAPLEGRLLVPSSTHSPMNP